MLISAILGTLYFIYIITYFFNGIATTSGEEQIGAGLATALVAPHMFVLVIAVLFNWIGWAIKARWAVLVGAILYCVSGFMFLLYAAFEVPSIILSFVGFAKMKKAQNTTQPDVAQSA